MKIILLSNGPEFLKPIEDAKVQAMVHASEDRVQRLRASIQEVQGANPGLEKIRQRARELGIKCGPVPTLKTKVG